MITGLAFIGRPGAENVFEIVGGPLYAYVDEDDRHRSACLELLETHPGPLLMAELIAKSRDLPLGAVDASVVAAAERLGTSTIATLDRRHFSVVRPQHRAGFALLP